MTILAAWPRSTFSAKPPLACTYLAFAGETHLEMLRESIASMAHTWHSLPLLRVVGDGTISPQQVRDALSCWPMTLEILDWRDLVAPVTARGYGAIVEFAKNVPMARKLVAIIDTAVAGPVLYADVDVLWFRCPALLTDTKSQGKPQLIMSPDFQPTYDASLVPTILPHLAVAPYYCAGILYASGDFLAACDLEQIFLHAAARGVAATEQTILAEADRQLGGEILDPTQYALFCSDRFSLRPSFMGKSWTARHYIGQVRHLFWRDALALRLRVGQTDEVRARRSTRETR